VGGYPLRWNPAAITQELNQLVKRRKLARGGSLLCEVSHQANPDSVIVVKVVRRFAMRAVFLLFPSGSNLNLAVTRSVSVPDYEMITQFIPTLRPMLFVE